MTLQRTMHPTPLPSSCIVAGAVFTELFSPQQKAHQKSLVYLLKGYHRNRAENTLHCVRSCVCFLGMYILLKRKSMNRTLGEYEELEDCVCSQTCTTSGAILFCRICSVRVSAPPYLSGWALDYWPGYTYCLGGPPGSPSPALELHQKACTVREMQQEVRKSGQPLQVHLSITFVL